MSSVVFYKFKSQKEPSRIAFDGTGISVWELKKEIILESKLGKGSDFDFSIYNENDEEYGDDHAVIPRSTSVLARRLPPSKPGRGNGQIYMAAIEGASGVTSGGKYQTGGQGGGGGGGNWKAGSMSKRFDGKDGGGNSGGGGRNGGGQDDTSSQEPNQVMLPAAATGDEASALAAMFAATSQQWQQTQEQMASATPIYRAPMPRIARPPPPPRDHSSSTSSVTSATAGPSSTGLPGTTSTTTSTTGGDGSTAAAAAAYHASQHVSASHKPPPAGYICYRCGQKGHWIQDCPTNADRAWDDKPRIKRTTGIPKSFLTVVEGPQPGVGGENIAAGNNVMVTPDGGFVVARPDNDSWLAHRSLTANLSATDIQNLAPTDPDLTCPICSKLLRDSVLTPCCKTAFCEECLHNALGDNDMLCPECESKVKNLGKLEVDKGRRERCRVYIEAMVEASKEVEKAEEVEVEVEVKEEGIEEVVVVGEVVEEEKKEVEAVVSVETASATPPPPPVAVEGGDALDSLIASVTSGGSTPVLHITSNNPSVTVPTGPAQATNAFMQQQQFIRQQQLQQQQRAMMMQQQQQQQGGMGMGMGMGMSPQMIQQNIYQLQVNLSNPQLHPQMRMQMQMQLQQCQIMAVQMGLIPIAGSNRLGNSIAQAYGGNFANGMRNGMPQQQQQQQQQQPGRPLQPYQQQQQTGIPTGPRGATSTDNLKRQRPEDFASASPERKRAPSPPEVPQGAPPY